MSFADPATSIGSRVQTSVPGGMSLARLRFTGPADDDYVAGLEHRDDAERFLADLRDRFAQFGLELHPDKTRLIEFGRFAARDRQRRGDPQA
jgi:hypothetical protein